jgi:hypothetical protein
MGAQSLEPFGFFVMDPGNISRIQSSAIRARTGAEAQKHLVIFLKPLEDELGERRYVNVTLVVNDWRRDVPGNGDGSVQPVLIKPGADDVDW